MLTPRPRLLALAALGCCLAAGLADAQGDGKPLVPDADYAKVLDLQLSVLTDTLKQYPTAKDKAEKTKLSDKARCAAVMIAAVAQDNLKGKDAAQRASLRDAALQVATLVKDDKIDAAAKRAAGLKDLKGDGKAKTERVKLYADHLDLQQLMSQYKLAKAGGQGIESALLKLATDKKKVIPPAAITDNLVATAYLSAVAAELTADHKPNKNVKDWQTYSTDMRTSAMEFADKLKAKDGKAAFTALNKLQTSCSVCHEKFR